MSQTTPESYDLSSSWQQRIWPTLGVLRYEWSRSFSPARISGWILLAFFPVFLVAVSRWQIAIFQPTMPDQTLTAVYSVVLFGLLPQVVTILGLLLWATPVINSELEGQTWVYALSRPRGRAAVLLGKYLVAIIWTATAGWTAATLSVPLIGVSDPIGLWWGIVRVVALSVLAYGGLYVTLGAFIQKRAMVVALVYTMAIEVFLSIVPATVNQLTIGFRLRSLAFQWLKQPGVQYPDDLMQMLDPDPQSPHLAILLFLTGVLLTMAVLRVKFGEYPLQPEAS